MTAPEQVRRAARVLARARGRSAAGAEDRAAAIVAIEAALRAKRAPPGAPRADVAVAVVAATALAAAFAFQVTRAPRGRCGLEGPSVEVTKAPSDRSAPAQVIAHAGSEGDPRGRVRRAARRRSGARARRASRRARTATAILAFATGTLHMEDGGDEALIDSGVSPIAHSTLGPTSKKLGEGALLRADGRRRGRGARHLVPRPSAAVRRDVDPSRGVRRHGARALSGADAIVHAGESWPRGCAERAAGRRAARPARRRGPRCPRPRSPSRTTSSAAVAAKNEDIPKAVERFDAFVGATPRARWRRTPRPSRCVCSARSMSGARAACRVPRADGGFARSEAQAVLASGR